MYTLGQLGFEQFIFIGAASFVIGFAVSFLIDRLILKPLLDDRVAGIALSCVLTFVLIMGSAAVYLTKTSPIPGPIIIPPVQFAVALVASLMAVGIIRNIIFSHRYAYGGDEVVFDSQETEDWDNRNRRRNYFVRHWIGNLPLPLSYWVNGFVASMALVAIANWIAYRISRGWGSLQALAIVLLVFLCLSLVIWIWSAVGIWRSAYWQPRRGGSAGWGIVARVMTVIAALAGLAQTGNVTLQVNELRQLASGHDPIGAYAEMSVSADGQSILVRGPLSLGAAERFADLLQANPQVTSAILTSTGGRILEAGRMASEVKRAGLATRVDDFCMSACVSVLLAGNDRSAPNLAKIGFHQPSFPGLSGSELSSAIERMRSDYLEAGVDPVFVSTALATPADDMWFPSADEMIAAGVLTGSEAIVVGRSARGMGHASVAPEESLTEKRIKADLQLAATQINAQAPRKVDEVTTLQRATASGLTLTRFLVVDLDHINIKTAERLVERAARRDMCREPAVAAGLRDGVRLAFSYDNKSGRHLFDFVISSCDDIAE